MSKKYINIKIVKLNHYFKNFHGESIESGYGRMRSL